MEQKVQEIIQMLEMLTSDNAIPKNIRKCLDDAVTRLKSNDELTVKLSAAVYLIESISEDINMPAHARTQIWAVISSLESLKVR